MPPEADMRRLRKSRSDRMIAGVCGGVAEYFRIDSTIVRVLWVLATIFGGWGLLLYIVAAIIMPKSPGSPQGTSARPGGGSFSGANSTFWGILLIGIGVILLLGHHGFPFWFHWWGFSWKGAAGIGMIIGGLLLMLRPSLAGRESARHDSTAVGDSASAPPEGSEASGGLRRSSSEKIVAGVCGGIGQYLNIDPVFVRLLFVLALFGSIWLVAIAYLALAIIVPKEDMSPRQAMA